VPGTGSKRAVPRGDRGRSGHKDVPPRGPETIPARRPAVAALAGYAGLAVVFFFPLLRRLTTHILADDIFIRPGESDAFNFLWGYWWIQKAVATGQSIFQCNWVLPPAGANLVFHTHSLLPTLLTYPLGRSVGTVAGYNLMVVLLIALGAWSYFLFLRRGLSISWGTAFVVGACFGFSPYFVFKTHAHINLIGACFWATALGVLVTSYLDGRFGWRRGVVFAVFFWATFWSSFVEFFLLAIVAVLAVAVFEACRATGARRPVAERLRFFLPAVAGVVSLAVFRAAPDLAAVNIALADALTWNDLLAFPRLSVFAQLWTTPVYEHWGTYVPVSVALLAIIGAGRWIRLRERAVLPLLLLALLALVLTFDVGRGPSTLIRALPMGGGQRVFARFFPFFLFFLAIFAAVGLDALWNAPPTAEARAAAGPRRLRGAAVFLCLVAAVELVPYRMQPSPVKQLPMTEQQRAQLDRGRFVLVIPHGPYLQLHDTYQIALDLPCVNLSYVAREPPAVFVDRMTRFPMTYGRAPVTSLAALDAEFAALNVGYLLVEDKRDAARLPIRASVVAEWEREILLQLERGASATARADPGAPEPAAPGG
jgi:hypothetical protein